LTVLPQYLVYFSLERPLIKLVLALNIDGAKSTIRRKVRVKWTWTEKTIFYKHNKPATFKQPFFGLACDFTMYKDILLKRVKWW